MTRPARYTHGHHESVLRSHRWRTAENSCGYLLPHLTAGMNLLDVGCGPGTITVDLARRARPGAVIGIDREESVLDSARDLANNEGIDVEFLRRDVYNLGFADSAFEVVHAHQLLQHLEDPVRALVEMRRVCAPGGFVAVRDADYAAMTWYPLDKELDRWLSLYRSVARSNGGEPDAGRRLLSWARAAGFSDVTATASTWCFSTPEDRALWGGSWADRVRHSSFADQALGRGYATKSDLDVIADAWNQWASSDDGWFVVVHGELICRT